MASILTAEAHARRTSGSGKTEQEGHGGGHRGPVGDKEKNSTERKALLNRPAKRLPLPHPNGPLAGWQSKENAKAKAAHRAMVKSYGFQMASQLWPGQDFKATPRCSEPHDGMVDAALITEHARRALQDANHG